jgi:uncharacterized protein (TIGR02996 family)
MPHPQPAPVPAQVRAFLRDIKERLEDDVPRLILADWLEERGDPRGGLVRVQVELARRGDLGAEGRALRERERGLLALHAAAWLGPLRDVASRWEMERGLVRLEASARDVVGRRRLPAAALAWVEALALHRLTAGRVRRLATWPALAEVVGLELRHNDLSDDAATALAASPFLDGLRSLDLSNNELGAAGGAALAAASGLAGLRRLDLSYNPLGPDGVAALAASPFLARLESLNLTRARLGERGAGALAASPHLGRLRLLNVYGNMLSAAATAALEARFGPQVYF